MVSRRQFLKTGLALSLAGLSFSRHALADQKAIQARLEALLQPAIDAGDFPGCVVHLGNSREVVFEQAWGERQVEPGVEAMTVDTIFDLASLTKPISTATSIMRLVQDGRVDVDATVASLWPEFGVQGKEVLTVRDLLTHQSGLIADNALSDYFDGPEKAFDRIAALKLIALPRTKMIYSDVNFLVLGKLVSLVSGQPLEVFFRESVAEPLGLKDTGYRPDSRLQPRIAPTAKQEGVWLRGQVHDPRAARLGGVAGHAGLFATAADLGVYARDVMTTLQSGKTGLFQPQVAQAMIAPQQIPSGRTNDQGEPQMVTRGLGWDIQSGFSRNRPANASEESFGHTGFTGTSIWIDPKNDRYAILLASRLHPDNRGAIHPLSAKIGLE